MAIYDIFEFDRSAEEQVAPEEVKQESHVQLKTRDRFLSSLTARLFFFLLLLADTLWFFYAVTLLVITTLLKLVIRSSSLSNFSARMWLSTKRSLVCGLSLFVTLFSPAFGIMIACTYFLMYDKAGIEEVVPSSLQSQFKEFFKS